MKLNYYAFVGFVVFFFLGMSAPYPYQLIPAQLYLLGWSLGFILWLNHRRWRLIRFAIRAYRSRNEAWMRARHAHHDWEYTLKSKEIDALQQALDMRRTWNDYEIQAALFKAHDALRNGPGSEEEQKAQARLNKLKAERDAK